MKSVGDYIAVRLLGMNDSIELSDGKTLWLDVDFDEMRHVPVVGEVISANRITENGDIVVLDNLAVRIALKGENNAKFYADHKGKRMACVFVKESEVIAVKRKDDVFTVNNYVIVEPFEEVNHSAFLHTFNKRSAVLGKVVVGNGEVSLGDVVAFRRFADIPLEPELHTRFFKGRNLTRMKSDRIMGVVCGEYDKVKGI